MKLTTYILIIIALVITTACERIVLIELDELPAVSQRFIENNFSDTKINTVEKLRGEPRYRVRLINDIMIWFYKDGDWQKVERPNEVLSLHLLNNLLPSNIIAYLIGNHSDTGAISVWKSSHGYNIILNTRPDIIIKFDNNGYIISDSEY
ncbi:MAG: PepSY-like domain-containing protein [Bacteroidales bacterium]